MEIRKLILSTVGGLIVLAATNIQAASLEQVNANTYLSSPTLEKSANDQIQNGVKINTNDIQTIAREGSSRNKGRRGANGADTKDTIIAREASEGPRGSDNNNQRRRGRNHLINDEIGEKLIAREASEGPRGSDNNNQRRRGRNS